jgi:hypothetical protein
MVLGKTYGQRDDYKSFAFSHCPSESYNSGKIHPEYSITYDRRIVFNDNAIHISAVVMSNPSIAQKPSPHSHKFLLPFDLKESEKLPDNKSCDHPIELLRPEDKL